MLPLNSSSTKFIHLTKHLTQHINRFNSNLKPKNIILIRHAQSVFNAKCHQYPQSQIYSKKAEEQFHHDPSIIDCPLTQRGFHSVKETEFQKFFQNKNGQNTIFFVSPMLRALQTAEVVLQTLSKVYPVMVIPQLSQVLSKICDFSSGINNKKEMFTGFDFRYFDQWIQVNGLCQFKQNWQDPFLDSQHIQTVDIQSSAGNRYLKTLKKVFPKPLQSSQKCRMRSIEGYRKIYQISQQKKYKNAVIISHNRILKNIQYHVTGRKVEDFDNLQIRKVKVEDYLDQE